MVYPNGAATQATVQRYVRETATGQYQQTHQVTLSPSSSTDSVYPVFAGAYIYVTYSDGGTKKIKRYDVADLLNATDMTVSGTAWTTGGSAFSDGTDIYVWTATDQFRRYTISGTTATHVNAITFTSAGENK